MRISRTAASIRAWSTGASTGISLASPLRSSTSRGVSATASEPSGVATVDLPAVRDRDHLGRRVLALVLPVVAVGHRAPLGLGEHRAALVDAALLAAQPDRARGPLHHVGE